MDYKTARFAYCMLFTLCVCLWAMYASYAKVIEDSHIDFSKPKSAVAIEAGGDRKEHASPKEGVPDSSPSAVSTSEATLNSSLESSRDTKGAFNVGTRVKIGLPKLADEAEVSADNGVVCPDGKVFPLVKLRVIKTFFKGVSLALYDDKDRLLLTTTDSITLRAAADPEGSVGAANGLVVGAQPSAQPEASTVGQAPTVAEASDSAPVDISAVCKLTGLVDKVAQSKVNASYRGLLTFILNEESLNVVNELYVEDYLKGVVPSEVPARFEPEAIKAMACVARSYTLATLGRHRNEGFDLCSGVHCHVYGGAGVENPKVTAQIEATAGQMICYGKFIADTRYHSTCGGEGESFENAWSGGQTLDYLQASSDLTNGGYWLDGTGSEGAEQYNQEGYYDGDGSYEGRAPASAPALHKGGAVENTAEMEAKFRQFIDHPAKAYCSSSTRFRWEAKYSALNFTQQIGESLPNLIGASSDKIGNVTAVKVTRRYPSGRVAELLIATDKDSFAVSGDKIRWIIGGGKINPMGLNSTLFYVDKTEDEVIFHGGGWGHGVGLCQEGAQGRALGNANYAEIIKHYYPGCELRVSHL